MRDSHIDCWSKNRSIPSTTRSIVRGEVNVLCFDAAKYAKACVTLKKPECFRETPE